MLDKYNHWLPEFLRWCNRAKTWAITLGQTTYYSESKEYVDKAPWWRKHEDCHKAQWAQDGCWKFITRYLWQLVTKVYLQIDYEVEAHAKVRRSHLKTGAYTPTKSG
jgi:hypothetical protein